MRRKEVSRRLKSVAEVRASGHVHRDLVGRELDKRPAAQQAGAFSQPYFDNMDGELATIESDLVTAEDAHVRNLVRVVQLRRESTELASGVYEKQTSARQILVGLYGSERDYELAAVLKHETVHSFVHRIAEGRAPIWLNEGLAQMESGESMAQVGPALARLYSQSRQVPMARLEGSFQRLDSSSAALAYAESHAAVEMLRDRYGAYQLPELLRSLGRGRTMEQALREVLRMTYDDLESELAQSLARRFGP